VFQPERSSCHLILGIIAVLAFAQAVLFCAWHATHTTSTSSVLGRIKELTASKLALAENKIDQNFGGAFQKLDLAKELKAVSVTSETPKALSTPAPLPTTPTPTAAKTMKVSLWTNEDCVGEPELVVIESHTEEKCKEPGCWDACDKQSKSGGRLQGMIGSVKVEGTGFIEMFHECLGKYDYANGGRPYASVFVEEGCTGVDAGSFNHFKMHKDTSSAFHSSDKKFEPKVGKYRIVYSCESSHYFLWQARINYLAFTKTKQNGGAHTRLMTASVPDDLMDELPSFQAKRHPFSLRYGPINKPDVLAKWFRSAHAPVEDVIVLIDPDNFLLEDISKFVPKVKKGQAYAQAAWFNGSPLVEELWKAHCKKNCDFPTDATAVPIFIHKDDLAAIAPLWRDYTIELKRKAFADKNWERRYMGVQIDWGAEMLGYVLAAAHMRVKHVLDNNLQMRDVDGRRPAIGTSGIPMLHAGRSWFPLDYEPGKKFWHTEGAMFAHGAEHQVWCKCNWTAGDVLPWPLPDKSKMDFISYHTLSLLHEQNVTFKDMEPTKFRQRGPHQYHIAYP
jgi:hypothetical protein